MKRFIIVLNLLLIAGCGGNSDPEIVVDYGGDSRFEVINNSNYTILIHCETYAHYDDCNLNSIEAGESQVIGEYSELGGPPSPEGVFISITVSYDPGDGLFLMSHELTAENWDVIEGESFMHMYSSSIVDGDFSD